MKLKLAYDNELDLPKTHILRERIEFINNNIFNNKKTMTDKDDVMVTYEEYYNINSISDSNSDEALQVRGRWLGVKRVGSPNKDESLKTTMDFLSTYLLNCKEHSVKHDVHELKVLSLKRQKSELTEAESDRLRNLRRDTIFVSQDDLDVVMYHNRPFETYLKERVDEEKDERIIKLLADKINMCKELRLKGESLASDIALIDESIDLVMDGIKSEYAKLKEDRNNEDVFESITEMIKRIRSMKQEKSHLIRDVECISDDYLQLTELQINIQ